MTELLETTGMVFSPGVNEPIDAKDERDLMDFIAKHTGRPPATPYSAFLQVYVDDCIFCSVSEEQAEEP